MQILQNARWCDICLRFGGLPRLCLWVGEGVFLFMAHSIRHVGVYTLQMFIRWRYYLVRSICFFFLSFQNILPQPRTHTKTQEYLTRLGGLFDLCFFFLRSIPFRNAANTLKCNTVPSREAVYENYSWIPRWVLWIITTSRQHNFTVGQRIAVLKRVECF